MLATFAVRGTRRLAFTCLAGALLAGAVGGRAATRDRPPTAFTGGFGESTCQLCHSEADVNAGTGRLALDGVPPTYEAGGVYTLTLTVVHAGMAAAGFELAARYEDGGAQAGSLAAAPGHEERADTTTDNGISYAHHLSAGTMPVASDTARWQLVWAAPTAGGTVVFHAVGNAANDDDSPLGDYVYAITAASRPR